MAERRARARFVPDGKAALSRPLGVLFLLSNTSLRHVSRRWGRHGDSDPPLGPRRDCQPQQENDRLGQKARRDGDQTWPAEERFQRQNQQNQSGRFKRCACLQGQRSARRSTLQCFCFCRLSEALPPPLKCCQSPPSAATVPRGSSREVRLLGLSKGGTTGQRNGPRLSPPAHPRLSLLANSFHKVVPAVASR